MNFLNKFLDFVATLAKPENDFNEDKGPPPDLVVPLVNIDFALPAEAVGQYTTEYQFTTFLNEHCYSVYDRVNKGRMQMLYMSGGKQTMIHVDNFDANVLQ